MYKIKVEGLDMQLERTKLAKKLQQGTTAITYKSVQSHDLANVWAVASTHCLRGYTRVVGSATPAISRQKKSLVHV